MKYLKKFEEQNNLNKEILNYITEKYPLDWWNDEFDNRVSDYVSEDELVGSGSEDEPEFESAYDAYTNLCMGGAIEYDLLDLIGSDIIQHFGINSDEYYDKYSDITKNYMLDTVNWCDPLVFN